MIEKEKISKRREFIRLNAKDMPSYQLAEKFGVCKETIENDAKVVGVKLLSREEFTRREMLNLLNFGLNPEDIANQTGKSIRTVYRYIGEEVKSVKKISPEIEKRRKKICELLKLGFTIKDIASIEGISKRTVYRYIKLLKKED